MIQEKLTAIQSELKAPKGQYNNFGKYKYRSCEDILESVKPLLLKNGCSLILSDDVVQIGDRYYIRATAKLSSGDECISNTAWAREDEQKKGMDGSQITGTASSYARKYALNGLFCIDDTKDADTNEFQSREIPENNPGAKTREFSDNLNQDSPAARKLIARAECQKFVKSYCKQNNKDENAMWKIIADSLEKASKDYTVDDWTAAKKIAEGWN